MTFSEYLKAIYGHYENEKLKTHLKSIRSKGHFVKALCFNAGSTCYEDDKKFSESGLDTKEVAIFKKGLTKNGKNVGQNLPEDIIRSFDDSMNLKKLASFFTGEITNTSLAKVMKNFGIDMDRVPTEKEQKLFIDALCSQFKLLIDEAPKSVDDIVKVKYIESIEREGISTVSEHFIKENYMKDYGNFQIILPKLKELSNLFNEHDFAATPYPAHLFFTLSDEIEEALDNVDFFYTNLAEAVEEYNRQKSSFTYELGKITFWIEPNGKGHISRAPKGVSVDFFEKLATLQKRFGDNFASELTQKPEVNVKEGNVEEITEQGSNVPESNAEAEPINLEKVLNCDPNLYPNDLDTKYKDTQTWKIKYNPDSGVELVDCEKEVRSMQESFRKSIDMLFTAGKELKKDLNKRQKERKKG